MHNLWIDLYLLLGFFADHFKISENTSFAFDLPIAYLKLLQLLYFQIIQKQLVKHCVIMAGRPQS